MPRVTIEAFVDDELREVQIDDENLPDGILSEAAVREKWIDRDSHREALGKLRTSTQREIDEAKRGRFALDELAGDEDQLTTFVTQAKLAGVDKGLRKLLKIDDGDDGDREKEIAELQAQIRKLEVEPLRGELEGLTTEVSDLRLAAFRAEYRSAAVELGVVPSLVPMLEDYYEKKIVYDPELRRFFIAGPDGKPQVAVATEEGAAPYRTVAIDLAEMKKEGKRPELFKADQRDGIGYQGTETRGSPSKKAGEMTATEKADFISEHGLKKFEDKVLAEQRTATA